MPELEDNLIALARLAKANGHGDLFSEQSHANLMRAQMLASIEMCDRCELLCALLPAAASRWVVEHLHEPHCPSHGDNAGDGTGG